MQQTGNDPHTDASTDAPTDAPTDGATDAPTDGATDAPTDGATDAATDGAIDSPAEPQADEPPAEAVAEAPVDETPPARSEEPEGEAEAPAEAPAAKERAEKRPRAGAPMVLRIALGISGLALLSGFFLPWVTIGDVANISGLELVLGENLPGTQRLVLGLCPVVAVVLTLAGVIGFRGSSYVGVIAGVGVLTYALFTIAYIIYKLISVGLWLVLFSAIIALGAGLFAILSSRNKTARA